MIQDNLALVRQNITDTAVRSGRKAQDITLVCVTKEAAIEQIRQAIACGVSDIGENRVQDAVKKYDVLGRLVKWHLIGHLQANKVKKAVEIFDLIHSVDSVNLAEAISKEAAKINKVQNILIQANISGEKTKFGIKPEETLSLINNILPLNNIKVLGLMTIAPLVSDPENARKYFRSLKELTDANNLDVLSMGMSNDYKIAIEEGATMVRIGSTIFK